MNLYNIYCIKCIVEFQIKVVRVNSFVIGIPHFFYNTIPHELTDLTVLDTTLLNRRGDNTFGTVLVFCYCFLDTLIATSLTRVYSRVQNSIVQLSLSCRFFGLSPSSSAQLALYHKNCYV